MNNTNKRLIWASLLIVILALAWFIGQQNAQPEAEPKNTVSEVLSADDEEFARVFKPRPSRLSKGPRPA
nr:hypothetical protein [Methylomarinum sp. Ch1-1]MDP4520832.1 hypothetical protein [Methylomarinum sp. Ch1-1]